jgi:predicted Rossmann fold flavoprotein
MPLELEEETCKLFPSSHRARDVRDGLVARVREAGARIWFGAQVTGLSREDRGWSVQIHGAPSIQASAVIVATGGLSVPSTGSDGAGLSMVQMLGHEVSPTYPALTPLTGDPHPHLDLAGIATGVTLTAPGSKPAFRTTDALLITHRGWSGPAVLDASHLATRGRPGDRRQEILVDWTDVAAAEWDASLLRGGGNVRSVVAPRLPRRLADSLVGEAGVAPETALAQLRRQDRQAIVEVLTTYRLPWTGHEGYKKAEVTGGGVRLEEINPRTMESRRTLGLYLCGEILDAFGPIGGHNFLWAFATGRAAGANV